jgi:hypothetical protein
MDRKRYSILRCFTTQRGKVRTLRKRTTKEEGKRRTRKVVVLPAAPFAPGCEQQPTSSHPPKREWSEQDQIAFALGMVGLAAILLPVIAGIMLMIGSPN